MTDTSIPGATLIPRDWGTANDPNPEHRGTAHAAQLASLAAQQGADSYRESGLTVVDNGDGTVDVNSGLGFLRYEGESQTYDYDSDTFSAWGYPMMFAVGLPLSEGLGITGGSSNDVWLAVDLDGSETGTPNNVFVRHGSDVSPPAGPTMQLASVAADGTVTPVAPDQPPVEASSLSGGVTGGNEVTSLPGQNLSIDDNGVLNATDTDTNLSDQAVLDIVTAESPLDVTAADAARLGGITPSGYSRSGHDHSGDSLGDNSPLSSINTEQITFGGGPPAPWEGGYIHADAEQDIPSGTPTPIQLNDTWYSGSDVTVGNDNLQPVSDGIYHVTAAVTFRQPPADFRYSAQISQNGNSIAVAEDIPSTVGFPTVTPSLDMPLSQGDLLTIEVFQNSGSPVTLSGDRRSTRLNVRRVA